MLSRYIRVATLFLYLHIVVYTTICNFIRLSETLHLHYNHLTYNTIAIAKQNLKSINLLIVTF